MERHATLGSFFGLAALLAYQAVLLSGWLGREDRPPSWDQAIHLEIAHDYAERLERGDWKAVLRLGPKPGMPPFPPLYELTLVPWVGRPDAANAVLWANFGWLAAFVVAVWGLGLLYAGPWVGLGAATLVACIPETQWLLRNHLSDLPLAACVALAYWALGASAGFMRWGTSLVAGGLVGAAMLTKWSAWTYLLPMGVLWVRAAGNRLTRWRAIASLGLALALCLPWYAAQLPVLLPRLVDATADQAVPVWHGWAIFSYVRILAAGLDSPFWALALVAVLAPRLKRGRDDGWLIVAWFVVSFVFWTIVPNRQMRFLLPAVAPLALFVPGVFPRAAIALCAWMVFSAANYTFGWVNPVVASAGPGFRLLSTELPAKEDWRIADILGAANARRDPGLPFSNLSLLANDTRFNGPAFHWERKRHGVTAIRLRGINSRYCELSEFVAIKEGSLGPKSVVNQLPEVRLAMLKDGSWFRAGYEQVESFPLPDGTSALLFQRRRRPGAPFKQAVLKVAGLETPQYAARGVTLKFGRWDPRLGAYERVDLAADTLVIRGVEVAGVKARLEGVDLVPVDGPDGLADVRLLRLTRLTLESAAVKAQALAGLIERRAKALVEPTVRLEDTVAVDAKLKGRLRVSAEARLELDERALRARLLRASLGPLPLPASLADLRLPLTPTPELPFELVLPGLTLKGGVLSIP
ncbi:MAG: hypothetical protein HY553_15120 [Elusimicrobia bacterium]|nr:hypothetical protein [Elusimicrobiota bacterium]